MFYTGRGAAEISAESFAGTGSNANFTLSYAPVSASHIIVCVDGLMQTPTDSYTVSGTTLTFTGFPPDGAAIVVRTTAV
jgi:hypothetical protein